MAKYIKREMNDLRGTGRKAVYYTMENVQCLTTDQFLAHICAHYTNHNPGDIRSVLSLVAKELADMMAQGYSVTIDDIGVFRAGLGLAKDDDTAEGINARSLCVDHILYKADRRLVAKTDAQCHLEKGGESYSVTPRGTREQRLATLLAWLNNDEHPFAHIADYRRLTGLSQLKAQQELVALSRDPNSGIKARGRGAHKVYVKE